MCIFSLNIDFLNKEKVICLVVYLFRVNRAASNEERGKINVGLHITKERHSKLVNIKYYMCGHLLDYIIKTLDR